MPERPKVTRAEFDRIECNRCGACCTKLWLPSPEELAEFITLRDKIKDPSPEWLAENDRMILWIEKLEPTGVVARSPNPDGSTHQYRCSRFVHDENGVGYCNEYELRPAACRGFPYGKPVHAPDFEECSWTVDIIEDNPVQRAASWIRKFRP